MTQKDGGSAFPMPPVFAPEGGIFELGAQGMTLRDYFAAKAMQGLLASCPWVNTSEYAQHDVAPEAYAVADLMLAERNKP